MNACHPLPRLRDPVGPPLSMGSRKVHLFAGSPDSERKESLRRQEAIEFLDALRDERGADALKNRPPIAVAIQAVPGFDLSKPEALHQPSVLVYPVPDPVITAYMARSEVTQRGLMSWQIGLGEDTDTAPVARMLQCTAPGVVVPEYWAASSKGPRTLAEIRHAPWHWLSPVRANPVVGATFGRFDHTHATTNPYSQPDNPARFGAIVFSLKHNSLWFKVHTHQFDAPAEIIEEFGPIDLDLRPAGRVRRNPRPIRPAAAVAVCEWAAKLGLELVDVDGANPLRYLRGRLARTVVAWTRPGRPAQAEASVGTRVELPPQVAIRYGIEVTKTATYTMTDPSKERVAAIKVTRASRAARLDATALADITSQGVEVVMHPAVADMAALASSSPVVDDRLINRQAEAVGRHVATNVGYANVSSVGAGKSVMALEGMRRRAERLAQNREHPGYRGLIVGEANIRKQFADEAEKWFPNAVIVRVDTSSQAEYLTRVLRDAGTFPVVVLTSYALASSVADVAPRLDIEVELAKLFAEDDADDTALPMPSLTHSVAHRTHGDASRSEVAQEVADPRVEAKSPQTVGGLAPHASEQYSLFDDEFRPRVFTEAPKPVSLGEVLSSVHWDDIVADEAACLRNHRSKQSKALWALRENADVAVALTGTPIARGLSDLGHIVSWARKDRHMFSGITLSEEFDLSSPEGVADFSSAFGPVLFRMDRMDFEDRLPAVAEPEVLVFEPSLPEKRLANAARTELKRAYDELVKWIEFLEQSEADVRAGIEDDEIAQAKDALVKAHGVWLSGTTIARMAASDPAALLGSTMAGVALLEGQGLLSEATAEPGTKRRAIVELCAKSVLEGERILVFTSFATVARALISDLRAAGIRVGEILGGGGAKRDRYIEDFRNSKLDVMVATAAGERGLNLQTATMLIHYDLPWTPDSVIQRTGRIDRIGSTAKQIRVLIPVMAGTIEERVAAIVAVRAVEMMQALDATRGRTAQESEFGHTFGKLVQAANLNEVNRKESALLEMTRELLAAA